MNSPTLISSFALLAAFASSPALAKDQPPILITNVNVFDGGNEALIEEGALADMLLVDGYSDEDCSNFLGGNMYRVIGEVWR